MGCNCGKSRNRFKEIIKQSVPVHKDIAPAPIPVPLSRFERRRIRIEARNKRIAARNAAILASRAAIEKKNLGSQ